MDTDMYRKKTVWRHREKTTIHRPRREAWNSSQKEPTRRTPRVSDF